MSHPSLTRLAALCAIAAATALGACAGNGDDTNAAVTADSAAGVVDSAPATTATTVAALLTDENVLALLDTAYAVMIEMDRLAQRTSANAEISAFAGRCPAADRSSRSRTEKPVQGNGEYFSMLDRTGEHEPARLLR